ncbi:3D domain-containing protein [Isobaculum melis]|uniref:3D (Asp-Asp-Asp) domain-containing protein n=1 Tax=Isobaculum melis TaxID=142588 RepID=A0A1H9PWF8_9LACT|nr:3D domain-containing protein [Isobaculum melis]SER52547.1 3D (Asp-Asp-Asp) domain-containing protein [Isobaculum melis]
MRKTIVSAAVVGMLAIGASVSTVFAATGETVSDKNETQTNTVTEIGQLFNGETPDQSFETKMVNLNELTATEKMNNKDSKGVKEPKPLVSYTVQKGDTLESLAATFEVDANELHKWNQEVDAATVVEPGQIVVFKTYHDVAAYQAQREAEVAAQEAEAQAAAEQAAQEEAEAQAQEVAAQEEAQAQQQATAPVGTPVAPTSGTTVTVSASAYSYAQPGLSSFTSLGIDLSVNPQVIAVDPSVIPLGSRVYVEGYGEAIAGDTGGAISGNRIDVHFSSVAACYGWGMRTVQVTILD